MCIRFYAKVEIIPCAFDTAVAAYDNTNKSKNMDVYFTYVILHSSFLDAFKLKHFAVKLWDYFSNE